MRSCCSPARGSRRSDPARGVPIPPDATEIDARGRWILPGLIDTNVHLSLYGGQNDRYESLVRYQPRQQEIVLEAAQIDLELRHHDGARQLRRAGAADRGPRCDQSRREGRRQDSRRREHPRLERAVLVLVQPRHGTAHAVPGTDERLHRAGRRRGADGDEPGGASTGDRRLSRQGPGLSEVRRHEPFRRADLHRLLGRRAARHRRRGAPPESLRRNARDEHRRAPPLHRRGHRRHPAPGGARRPRAAGRPGRHDPGPRPDLLDALEHDRRAGLEEASENEGRSGEEAARGREG